MVTKEWHSHLQAEENVVVGRTSEGSPNSFMCTEKTYSDFELSFSVKVDDALNSGVQIRSRSTEEFNKGRVHGPQVEIETVVQPDMSIARARVEAGSARARLTPMHSKKVSGMRI